MRKKIFAPKLYPLDFSTSKTWFIKYQDKRGITQKKYGILNKLPTVAERMQEANKMMAELNQLLQQPITSSANELLGFLSNLLEYKKPMIEKKSFESFDSILNLFARWYREAKAKNNATVPLDYVRHMYTLGLHKNTIRNRILVLKGLSTQLVKSNTITNNPFDGLVLKKVKAQSKLPFTREQLNHILPVIASNDAQLKMAVEFSFYLFYRPKELRLLKIEHILFSSMQMMATDDVVKDDDNYLKIIPAQLQPTIMQLQQYPANFYVFGKNGLPGTVPLTRDSLSKRCVKILRQQGYHKRYTMYSFVHTGIKMAVLGGVPIKQLQLQKGHSDLHMFNEYLKDLGAEDMQAIKHSFPTL